MKTNNKEQKSGVISAVKKLVSDKDKWLQCIEQGKPLSTLADEGVILVKLR